MVNIYNKQ